MLPAGTAVAGADNRGLRYGDGLFETMLLQKGNLQAADEHFARLWKGMAMLHFELPPHFTPEALVRQIDTLVKKNGHERAARVRLQVIRGDGGLFDPTSHAPQYILQSWGLPAGHGAWNSNGLVAGIYPDARKSCDAFSNLKHNNYLPYLLAAIAAKKEKWNDAVLLNSRGHICDSTIANIFLVSDGTILTPSLEEGCVAGITRARLLRFLRQSGYQVRETAISRDQLLQATEVFVTNSLHPIRWVQRIGDTVYTHKLTQKIYTDFLPTIL